MIAVVTFDADGTLCDFQRVMAAAHLQHVYLTRRFGEAALYPDVRPALDALGGRYRLGLVSNGNSYPERSGLGSRFAFTVFAHDHSVQKPDRRFYELVLASAGVAPSQIVHVGDSLVNDVGGAQAAGIRALWLNGRRLPPDADLRPDAEIATLSDLPVVLQAFEVR